MCLKMIDPRRCFFRPVIQFVRQRSLWPLISISVLVLVGLLSQQDRLAQQDRLVQLNRLVQDFTVAGQDRELSGDIVIVAIDDESIAALGRWPWRRTLHAELLDRISADEPKAIGLDILFTEPEQTYVHDDAMLAASIQRNAPVVLPVFVQRLGNRHQVIKPLDSIATYAAGLGQAHIKIDGDGIVRSVYLQEQVNSEVWDQFGAALLKAGGDYKNPVPEPASPEIFQNNSSDWTQDQLVLIPYSGPARSFEYISYIDVIRGEVPTGTFKNKYVLVGATAIGIGDQYATPASGKTHLMPGVEILANITDALLHDISIQAATSGQNTLLNVSFVGVALIGFVLLSPFFALLLTVGLALGLLSITYFSAGFTDILFAPAAGVLGLMIIYPLWSWHRLSTAARFLVNELESFQQGGHIPLTVNKHPLVRDFLDRRIVALKEASRQLQSLHKFVTNSLDNLPYPTLISGLDGLIRIANHSAAQHFHAPDSAALINQYLPALVADVISNEHATRLIADEDILHGSATVEGEAKDSEQRDLIVKCVPIMNADNLHTGWILSLVDISKLRQAEHDREEASRFITHDIRAPLSSIITLLELRRMQGNDQLEDLMQRLERYADNALALADDFTNLSRAKSGEYRFDDIDLASLLSEVVDEAWVPSQKRNIHIRITTAEEFAYARADYQIVKRALTNLISNAIKFSPDNAEVLCGISRQGDYWDITVKDHGVGIAPELQKTLFQPFKRLHTQSHPEIAGIGLGLAFVSAAVKRHDGRIQVESSLGSGSTFHLKIPIAIIAEITADSQTY